MEITVTFRIEPEEFGRALNSIPPELRKEFMDAAITAYPTMVGEFIKQSGFKMPDANAVNLFDPLGIGKFWASCVPGNKS